MYCRKCGTWCEDSAVFCTQCGEPLAAKNNNEPPMDTNSDDYTNANMNQGHEKNLYTNAYMTNNQGGNVVMATYAGFWKRFLAIFIDGIILMIVNGILGFILKGIGSETLLQGVAIVIGWLYYSYMESSEYQATLGKMALQLRVTDLEGNRISFARATGRYFGKIISGLILCIGYMMAGWTEKKQALHDIMAGTLVVSE